MFIIGGRIGGVGVLIVSGGGSWVALAGVGSVYFEGLGFWDFGVCRAVGLGVCGIWGNLGPNPTQN